MIDRVIVSICGPSGSGKSILAKEIVKAIGRDMAARIPGDYFLKSSKYETFEEFIFTPFHYDWKLVDEILSHRLGTEVQAPEYDFHRYKRIKKTGGPNITIQRYLIIDSILPYPKSDFTFLITSETATRKTRLKERDKRSNTNVISNWKKLELTYELIENSKKHIHLNLNGENEPGENLEAALSFLRARKVLD